LSKVVLRLSNNNSLTFLTRLFKGHPRPIPCGLITQRSVVQIPPQPTSLNLCSPSRACRSPWYLVRFLFEPILRKRCLFCGWSERLQLCGDSSAEFIHAVVEMKQRNPRWGCLRIAEQIALAFNLPIDKDAVRRILAHHYLPEPGSGGPSWLTLLGHMKDSLWSMDSERLIRHLLCSALCSVFAEVSTVLFSLVIRDVRFLF
jgi:hypothetical protein